VSDIWERREVKGTSIHRFLLNNVVIKIDSQSDWDIEHFHFHCLLQDYMANLNKKRPHSATSCLVLLGNSTCTVELLSKVQLAWNNLWVITCFEFFGLWILQWKAETETSYIKYDVRNIIQTNFKWFDTTVNLPFVSLVTIISLWIFQKIAYLRALKYCPLNIPGIMLYHESVHITLY